MRVVSLSVNVMISCHDWKLGRPYVHNLRTCEQVHFCELGTEILAVESPSSEEKWLFLARWRLPRKKFPRNSDKWACSCRLSLRGRRKKGREIGRGRKSPVFTSSQCSTILRRQQAQCLQDVKFFTDSAIFRFDWVVASLKYIKYGELCSASVKMSLGDYALSLFYQCFEIMVRIASMYSLYFLLRRYSPGDHQKDPLIAKNN